MLRALLAWAVTHDQRQRVALLAEATRIGLDRLRALRASLRERMQRSPLMDAARFAHCIERAYRGAWRAHCRAARR